MLGFYGGSGLGRYGRNHDVGSVAERACRRLRSGNEKAGLEKQAAQASLPHHNARSKTHENPLARKFNVLPHRPERGAAPSQAPRQEVQPVLHEAVKPDFGMGDLRRPPALAASRRRRATKRDRERGSDGLKHVLTGIRGIDTHSSVRTTRHGKQFRWAGGCCCFCSGGSGLFLGRRSSHMRNRHGDRCRRGQPVQVSLA